MHLGEASSTKLDLAQDLRKDLSVLHELVRDLHGLGKVPCALMCIEGFVAL